MQDDAEAEKWGVQSPAHLSLSGDVQSYDPSMQQQMPSMIYVQPPSGAAKIMGILIIIYGAFGLLGSLATVLGAGFLEGLLGQVPQDDLGFDPAQMTTYLQISGAVGLLTSAGTLLGGVWTMQYQRRGVHLGLVMIAASFLIGVVLTFIFPEISGAGAGGTVGAIISSVVGSAVCGVLVAIPLMVSDNGLDDSSLFPR